MHFTSALHTFGAVMNNSNPYRNNDDVESNANGHDSSCNYQHLDINESRNAASRRYSIERMPRSSYSLTGYDDSFEESHAEWQLMASATQFAAAAASQDAGPVNNRYENGTVAGDQSEEAYGQNVRSNNRSSSTDTRRWHGRHSYRSNGAASRVSIDYSYDWNANVAVNSATQPSINHRMQSCRAAVGASPTAEGGQVSSEVAVDKINRSSPDTLGTKGLDFASIHGVDEVNEPREDEIGPNDVLCGRCSTSFNNIGNRRFRVRIGMNVPDYITAKSKADKSVVIQTVIREIHSVGGRFLKRQNGRYVEVDNNKIREKVGHALRDLSVTTVSKSNGSVPSKRASKSDRAKTKRVSSSTVCSSASASASSSTAKQEEALNRTSNTADDRLTQLSQYQQHQQQQRHRYHGELVDDRPMQHCRNSFFPPPPPPPLPHQPSVPGTHDPTRSGSLRQDDVFTDYIDHLIEMCKQDNTDDDCCDEPIPINATPI